MKESLYSGDRRVVFRETFDSEDGVRSRGGMPTNISFENGIGTIKQPVALNTSIIYNRILNGIYTLRFIITAKDLIPASRNVIDCRGVGYTGTGNVYILSTNTVNIQSGGGTAYVNGVATSTFLPSVKNELVISGISCVSGKNGRGITLLNTAGDTAAWDGSIELLEIYQGTLTANEVKNLYENKAYKPFQPHGAISGGSTANLILDVNAFTGVIRNTLSGNVLGGVTVPSVVNTAVAVRRDGNINAMVFNGSTSKLDCGSYNGLTGDLTIVYWGKTRAKNSPVTTQSIIYNSKLSYFYDYAYYNVNARGFSIISAGNLGIAAYTHINTNYFNFAKYDCFVVTRTSTGVCTFYKNGSLITASSTASGTPSTGTNIFIGNDGAGNVLDGSIASLRIFSGILSTPEISQIYQSEKSKYNL